MEIVADAMKISPVTINCANPPMTDTAINAAKTNRANGSTVWIVVDRTL